jgi:hypothetical protein
MKKKYLDVINKQHEKIISEISKWEERNLNSKVFPFYKKILYFAFYDSKCLYKNLVKTEIYTGFLIKICGCTSDLRSFILSLQSFLSNAVLDDSYFKIIWKKIQRDTNDRVTNITKKIVCNKTDKDGYPEILFTHDEDKERSNDIKLLEEALEIIIERQKRSANIIKRAENITKTNL